MSLSTIDPLPFLNTSTNEIITSFYEPVLAASCSYDRGVGFFTSQWLRLAAKGLSSFANNAGRARFIVSPIMSASDWAALIEGEHAKRDGKLSEHLLDGISDIKTALEQRTLSTLSWMVADGLLEFKIAIPTAQLSGDFHDKFGIFTDGDGGKIAFHGSQNDSAKAYQNYESISIFYSKIGSREQERIGFFQDRFNQIWENSDPNVRCYDLPEAIKRKLVRFSKNSSRPYIRPPHMEPPANELNKWRHQDKALAIFLENKSGVLEMATGTGKTRTAMNIIEELIDHRNVTSVLITMSGNDLINQWWDELLTRFHHFPIYRQYSSHKELSNFMSCQETKLILVARQQLKNVLPQLTESDRSNGIIICDEVHGMGSASMVRDLEGLISPMKYRLGLSATPERVYDEIGTAFITSEIGEVIFKFGLEEAISRGILCEFDYKALDYSLSDDDRAKIAALIRRHHAKKSEGEFVDDETLYRDIARVRKVTREKLPPFERFLKTNRSEFSRCLIFVETSEFGKDVQDLLIQAGVSYHTYFQADHQRNLERFADGDLECLISCHRLSEGIDIKSVKTIVLMSSARAKLETVQRLGRCLRVNPDNPDKRALVVDLIDDGEDGSDADVERREWFASLAKISNSHE
jgi:superfamily II DNA or RNA helicase